MNFFLIYFRIIFPSEKDEDREIITILGTKESVAAAKIELESRIKVNNISSGVCLLFFIYLFTKKIMMKKFFDQTDVLKPHMINFWYV